MRRINTLKTLAIVVLATICVAFASVSVSMLDVAKAETTSSQAADVVLDMNGTEANLEATSGVTINKNTDFGLRSALGLFPYAKDESKTGVQFGEIPEGTTATVKFNKTYKASDFGGVALRLIATGEITAYSLSDDSLSNPAGTLKVNDENSYATLTMAANLLADANGDISGFKIYRNSKSNNLFLDSVTLQLDYTVDGDGSSAWFEVDGSRLKSHTYDCNSALNVFGGSGTTDFMWTEDSHADKEIFVKLATPVKAEDYDAVEVKIAGGKNKIITAYALSDTDCSYPAGVTHIFGTTAIKYFTLNAKILANTDGYIEGFKFKKTALDSGGQYFIDYIKFVKYAADDYIKMTYPVSDNANASKADSYGAWFEVDGTAIADLIPTKTFGLFDNNDVKMTFTTPEMVAKPVTVRLATPVKAKKGMEVAIRLAVGKACTLDGYALSDTSFSTSAGSVVCGGGNGVVTLALDSEMLADGDGYIRGFVFKRTAGDAADGQYFADRVYLISPKDTVLDMNLTDAWFEYNGEQITECHPDNTVPVFSGNNGSTKMTWTEGVGTGAEILVKFGKSYHAKTYPLIKFRVCVGNWNAPGNTITSEILSLDGTKTAYSFETEIPSGAEGVNQEYVLMIKSEYLADKNGKVSGFILKKASQTVSGATGQYFADYVELLKDKDCVITVADGETTTTVAAKLGETVKVSELGANDGENDKVVGYKINGKLYSADYSFTLTEDVEIEAVRLAFKMRVGASIRRSGDMGLRFIVDLSGADFAALQNLVGENNLTLGIAITKKDNGKTVEKPATNRIDDGSGNIIYCGVVTGIPETSYKTQFSSQAFADIVYADGSNRVYAIENDNVRSVYDVAVNALASGTLSEADRAYFESVKNTADENASSIQKIILPDYDAKKNEYGIDISGWLIPKNISTADVDWITDAGINVMHAVAAGDSETLFFPEYNAEAEAKLNFFRDKGIQIYVNTCSRDADSFRKISSFGRHDGVIGMSYDEPTKAEIDEIAKYVDYFNQNGNGKNMLVNLFPSFTSSVKSDFGKWYNTTQQKYELYLQYYCDNVLSKLTSGEKWLSADRYLLTYDKNGKKCLDNGWLADVQSVAKVAKNYGAKTNFFVQTMAYGATNGVASGAQEGSRDRVPTYNDIRLQQYALMAFGYDGISLFCYGSPAAGGEFSLSQTGIIDRNGNKTETYEAVKKANGEILAFDHVLKQFAWQGVFTCDAGKTITGTSTTSNASFKTLDRISLANVSSLSKFSASADTLCGYFKDAAGNDGIMVVNYNETTENLTDTVELTFDSSKYNAAVCHVGGVKKVFTGLTNGKLSLSLGAGEGIFVIPYAE